MEKIGKKLNMLVVEDDADLRDAIYDFLLSKSINVFVASNGEEAIQIVLLEDIDFILSDIKMPLLNGIELLKKLSESSEKIPLVLYMSGESNYTHDDVLKLGAIGLINKPFTLDVLYKKILEAI